MCTLLRARMKCTLYLATSHYMYILLVPEWTTVLFQVIDKDPANKKGLFEDVSQVEKYEMSQEAYSKRGGEHTCTLYVAHTLKPSPDCTAQFADYYCLHKKHAVHC